MTTSVNPNRIPITSKKDILLVFAKKIRIFLDHHADLSNSNDETDAWLEKLTALCNAGFGITRFSRHQFAKHILGHDTTHTSITNLILGLREQFPPIDKHFEFQPSINDTDLWHMAERTLPLSDDDTNNPTNDKNTEGNNMPTVTSQVTETSIPINEEHQNEGQWIDVPITSTNSTNPTTNVPVTPTPFSTSN
jgi:hypothetical protein